MCGRYALSATATELIDAFKLIRSIDFDSRYNIAPSLSVPVIRQSPEGERVADLLKWGLVPHWAKDESIGAKLNNARSETATEKPSFREAFKRRRCLVPATGFYEWKTEGKSKQPYFIHYKSGDLLAIGGLWESWKDPNGEIIRTFCVLTTSPNEIMAPIHDRMPVLIQPEDYARWLSPDVPGTDLAELLTSIDAVSMEAWPVDKAVSKSGSEGPQLIVQLEA